MPDEQISRNLRLPAAGNGPAGQHPYYQKSWALIMGINDYEGRPLKNARNDAEAFAALLKEKYGFDEIIPLLDKDASRENILRYLREDLKDRVGPEDRLIIFFSGHGESQLSKDGGRIGYIVPQDARKDTLIDHIDMDELRKACDRIPAKHILIILDCCFSGVAAITSRIRGRPEESPKQLTDVYLRKLTEKKAYQIMTAGDVDQPIRDSGNIPGHSAFTAALLDGLRGDADRDSNGLITATELFDYIQPRVSCETSADGAEGQMPFLDYISGIDIYHPGNFVFLLPNIMVSTGDEQKKDRIRDEAPSGQIENRYPRSINKVLPFLATVIIILIFALAAVIFVPLLPTPSPDDTQNQTQTGIPYSSPETSPGKQPDMPADLVNSYSKINNLVEKREFANALNIINNIIKKYPEYNEYNLLLKGWALNKKGYYEEMNGSEEADNTFAEAIDALELAYALDPKNEKDPPNVYILNEKGNTYHYMGKYDLAIEWNNAAIEMDPDMDFVWFDRGLIFLDQERCKEAVEAFDRAIQLNPDDTESKDLRERAIQCAQEANS